MDKRAVKRRDFLKVTAAAALGTAVTACGTKEKIVTQVVTQQVEKVVTQQVEVTKEVQVTQEVQKVVTQQVEKQVQVTVEVPKGVAEPPFLQAKVASGELPPLDQRMPGNPLVVGGRDAIGTYGGEIRMILNAQQWFESAYDLNSDRFMHYSDVDFRTIVPNVLESWSASADAKEWTFKMRAGMKWSDGEPITSDDVRFWWEDACQALGYEKDAWWWGVPWQMRFGGDLAKVEFPDDFTFKFTFAAPYGNFGAQMTRWGQNINGAIFPAHFFKKYIPKYSDQASIDALVAAEGQKDWKAALGVWANWQCGSWYGPPGVEKYPVYCAWHIVANQEANLYQWERNPYYWKVDLAGNQLPYVDTLRMDYVSTTDATKLKLVQGEIDILGQHDVTVSDYPYYKQNADKGNYIVGDYTSCMGDRFVLFPQHYLETEDSTADNHIPDDAMNEIVNHPNWVKALSLAIDRSEVNDSLYFGLARVGQLSPMPISKYYKPSYSEAWAQFDKDQANKLLDEMGLDKKDSEGFRLRKDGKRLSYLLENCGIRVGAAVPKYCEMVVSYWRDIGIDAASKEMTTDLYGQRLNAYKTQCGVWHADRCTDMLLPVEPQWYIPVYGQGQGGSCTAWSNWYGAVDRTAKNLVQPPDNIKPLYDDFAQMTAVLSEDERVQWGQKIFDFLAENPLEIGLVVEGPAPIIFNKNLRNIPRAKSIIGWDTYGLSTYHAEAFYFEGGQHA